MLAEKGIDERMASDWAAIREKHTVEEPAPEPVKEAEAPAPDAAPVSAESETPPAIDRSRDDAGRFAKEPKDKPKAEAKPEAAVQPAAEAPKEEGRDVNRAPSTWKPTARAEWDKLPPTIRAEIHRRESDFMQGQSQLLPDAKLGANVRELIAPYRMLIEAEGSTPEKAIADILRTSAVLRIGTPEQKYAAFAQAARQYGIDLAVFAPRQSGENQAQPQLQQNFRDSRVDQLLAHLQQQDQQRAQHEQSELENTVTRWMNAADEKGEPRYPYLNDVINDMSALITRLKEADPTLSHADALQQAYDRAIWANPEVRALLQTKQQTELEAKRRTDNQERVANARRAASVNVPRRASTPSPAKPGSMDETLTKTARELGLIS